MLENYLTYLVFLNNKLTKFFESQKQFIFCQKGCAKCCKNAEFPYSQIELKYLLYGFLRLDKKTQNKIEENIKRIVEEKSKYKGDDVGYVIFASVKARNGDFKTYKAGTVQKAMVECINKHNIKDGNE